MSSTKLVVVLGATGQQGGSVISALRNDPTIKIRALTRNPSSKGAELLVQQGIDVVAADCGDINSLIAAFQVRNSFLTPFKVTNSNFQGAHAIFAVTNFWEPLFVTGSPEIAQNSDYDYGKNLADAAAAIPTLSHYIWSTIPSASEITGGKISVPHFEGKAQIDKYILNTIPALAAKTTFLWVGYYGLNSFNFPMIKPTKLGTSGKYIVLQPCSTDTLVSTIALTSKNVGLFVKAILAKPEITLPAKYVLGSTDTITNGGLVELLSEISGKEIDYLKVSAEDYDKVWPVAGKEVALQMQAWEIAGNQSWTKTGVTVVTKDDLAIEGLVGLRETLEGADWSSIE
jgi:hypothetical protein